MTIRPLSDKILVRPKPMDEVSAGGVIIPGSVKEKPQSGTVVAVGNGRDGRPMQCYPDATILYHKYAGTEVDQNGEKLLIMRETDVLAIID